MRTFLSLFLAAGLCASAAPVVHRDLAYAEPKDPLRSLDLYVPPSGEGHPIVVWIHGGGWRKGDKGSMQKKPAAFAGKGFVLASVNYRLFPAVTIREMMSDVARAVRWLHDHAGEYRADARQIFVMGHSAGAHLAALLCTDGRYLRDQGVSLEIIKGCVPVDVSAYDIPKRVADFGATSSKVFVDMFGRDEAAQRELSPVYHIAPDRHIPPFLILYVASRPEPKAQSEWFRDKLKAAGVTASVFGAKGKTHGTINNDLGLPDDPATQAVWKFLDESRRR